VWKILLNVCNGDCELATKLTPSNGATVVLAQHPAGVQLVEDSKGSRPYCL
jgi:hypothetical protein